MNASNRLSFIKKETGSVTVEMAFVIIGFVLLLMLVVDFGVVMLKHSKLERVGASTASVFREREALYSEGQTLSKVQAEQINQQQIDELGEFARKLMGDSDLALRVDALYFAAGSQKIIDKSETFYFGRLPTSSSNSSNQCATKLTPLDNYAHLSPFSELDRWMPLYRITVCIPGRLSLYQFVAHKSEEKIVDGLMASNITLPR